MGAKSSTAVKVFKTVAELNNWHDRIEADAAGDDRPILGFVPTMGALHDGHMTLVRQAVAECRYVVLSIFVNPLQFGPGEDFAKYPRPFEKDLELCRQEGVDAIFYPDVDEMYPEGQSELTTVIPPAVISGHLCGAFRPGHFTGVATVVAKLFGMVRSTRSYFGEKDYQQLAVIRRMVFDLNIPVQVVGVPTGREADGLAMSSRNVYLNPQQRQLAPILHQTLCEVRDQAVGGKTSLRDALEAGRKKLTALEGVTLQYLEACDPASLAPLSQTASSMVILVAAKFGDVRLIDNVIVRS